MTKLIIIGGGNMGLAIADGVVESKVFEKKEILIVEKEKKQILKLKKNKFNTTQDIKALEDIIKKNNNIQAILIAIKPSDFQNLLQTLKDIKALSSIPLISIAAGIQIKNIFGIIKNKQPIIRVMPNTPCQVRAGISTIVFNKYVTKSQKGLAKKIFNSLGKVIEIDERYFDVITAISGSGPAYYCYFIEALVKSAQQLGLTENIAKQLVLSTGDGTFKLLKVKGISPRELREKVTSPKGTTEAALKVFEKGHMAKTIRLAVQSAKRRGAQLGKIYT